MTKSITPSPFAYFFSVRNYNEMNGIVNLAVKHCLPERTSWYNEILFVIVKHISVRILFDLMVS